MVKNMETIKQAIPGKLTFTLSYFGKFCLFKTLAF
jgi:hypothetical protein